MNSVRSDYFKTDYYYYYYYCCYYYYNYCRWSNDAPLRAMKAYEGRGV